MSLIWLIVLILHGGGSSLDWWLLLPLFLQDRWDTGRIRDLRERIEVLEKRHG
jgi:hypothetical protein